VKTWAPKGQTPVLQYHFNWHQLSVIAGITFRRFYFRLFPGAIKGPQVIEFLQQPVPRIGLGNRRAGAEERLRRNEAFARKSEPTEGH